MEDYLGNLTAGLVTDDLWAQIEPVLPPAPKRPKGGRPRIDDRAVLTGVLFVLGTGIAWDMLPSELGCGSGMTCWRRLRSWQQDGTWNRIVEILLSYVEEGEEHRALRIALERAGLRLPDKAGLVDPRRAGMATEG
ncbi:MAG: transposase [Herpetosiphonaceae bacterium]|nr:MAG: transposase [Herpetosiphonaceae bacterium]